jgi:hypothetical protein
VPLAAQLIGDCAIWILLCDLMRARGLPAEQLESASGRKVASTYIMPRVEIGLSKLLSVSAKPFWKIVD